MSLDAIALNQSLNPVLCCIDEAIARSAVPKAITCLRQATERLRTPNPPLNTQSPPPCENDYYSYVELLYILFSGSP